MKIIVKQKNISKSISIVQKGISSRSSLQILNGILIEAKDNKLKLTSTDLEVGIETYLDCEIIEEGSIVVNSRIFGDLIKKLPQADILIDVKEFNINIVCENSEFNILGNNPVEYPDLPTIINQNTFDIPMDLFKAAIRQTVLATSQDETRPILTGVLFEINNGKASFVALDGYRLALRNIPIDLEDKINIVIPAKTLLELNKILDDNEEELNITIAPNHIIFNLGDTTFSSRLLEGEFLNYRDIIREEHNTKVVVDKKEFQSSLERASLLAKEEKANLIKLNIEDNKIIIKSNSEIGNVNEEIYSNVDGEDLHIAFNSRYLLEGIKVIETDDIELLFMGSLNPCIIKPVGDQNYTYLVLPVRLAQDDY